MSLFYIQSCAFINVAPASEKHSSMLILSDYIVVGHGRAQIEVSARRCSSACRSHGTYGEASVTFTALDTVHAQVSGGVALGICIHII